MDHASIILGKIGASDIKIMLKKKKKKVTFLTKLKLNTVRKVYQCPGGLAEKLASYYTSEVVKNRAFKISTLN